PAGVGEVQCHEAVTAQVVDVDLSRVVEEWQVGRTVACCTGRGWSPVFTIDQSPVPSTSRDTPSRDLVKASQRSKCTQEGDVLAGQHAIGSVQALTRLFD